MAGTGTAVSSVNPQSAASVLLIANFSFGVHK